MLGNWPGTIIAVSHERGFVEALKPTYCLRLPEERTPTGVTSTSTTSRCAEP